MSCLVILSCLVLGGCASTGGQLPTETITTYIVVPSGLRHHAGAVDLMLSLEQAQGYRCYSVDDDLTWRNRMSALEALQSGL